MSYNKDWRMRVRYQQIKARKGDWMGALRLHSSNMV